MQLLHEPTRSPIRRLGGKHQQAQFIVDRIPEHRVYVEVFAGSAAVFFRKGRPDVKNYREVLNDLDEGIYALFVAMRDQADDLADLLNATPYSRKQAREAIIEAGDTRVTKAMKMTIALYQTFAGKGNLRGKAAGWSFGRVSQDHPQRWAKIPQEIRNAAARLKEAYIDCVDFERCVRLWDTPETFFFCDPPYVGCEDFYNPTFTPDDHERLSKALRSIKGKALVTYYDNDLVRRLYRGWRIDDQTVVSRASLNELGGSMPRKSELYLMNYSESGKKIATARK